jgi:hypothetical protein
LRHLRAISDENTSSHSAEELQLNTLDKFSKHVLLWKLNREKLREKRLRRK